MVALKIFLLVSFLFLSSFSFGMPIPIDSGKIKKGAWQSLTHCQQSRSIFWAKLLDQVDPPSAFLYRLAWLQASEFRKEFINHSTTTSLDLEWKWRWNGELWSDELDLWNQGTPSCVPKGNSVSYSNLPGKVVRGLMTPQLATYSHLGSPARVALKDYLVFLWAKGERHILTDQEMPSQRSINENCEWRALKALHSEAPQLSVLKEISHDCTPTKDPLWAEVGIQLGDLYMMKALPDLALASYKAVLKALSESQVSMSLKYRIAASALLSQGADDFAFRAGYEILSLNESNQELDSTYRGIIENLVCDRVQQMQSREVISTFSKVFQTKVRVTQTLMMTGGVPIKKWERCGNQFLPKLQTPEIVLRFWDCFFLMLLKEDRFLRLAGMRKHSPRFHSSRRFFQVMSFGEPCQKVAQRFSNPSLTFTAVNRIGNPSMKKNFVYGRAEKATARTQTCRTLGKTKVKPIML